MGKERRINDLDFEEGIGAPILVHSACPLVSQKPNVSQKGDSRLRSTQHQTLSTLTMHAIEHFEHVVLIFCFRLVYNNYVRVLRSIGFSKGVPEVLHTLFKRYLERWNVEDIVLDLVPARGVGAADDGDCLLELATTSKEFTVEPNIRGKT